MEKVPTILATIFAFVDYVRIDCFDCGRYFGRGSSALFEKVNHVCGGVENVGSDRDGVSSDTDLQND